MRLVILLIFTSVQTLSFAASPEPKPMMVDEALRQHLLLTAPPPDYPPLMRLHRVGGKGLFQLRFDYDTGHLREVHVVQGTGAPLLDGYTIGALKLWKAKPHSLH